jgi:hypothetical protein
VEEAGDAANASTLARCKRIDPEFKRTVLVRNKLDKCYKSLSNANVNQWIQGFGDLPDNLMKFAISLPHFNGPLPPKPFVQMRQDCSKLDIAELKGRCGASDNLVRFISFDAFAKFLSTKIEAVFGSAIAPCVEWLSRRVETLSADKKRLEDELHNTDPAVLTHTIRAAGVMFAKAAAPVMGGHLGCHRRRVTLEQELLEFNEWCKTMGHDVSGNPSEEFACLEDYIDYLRLECKVPSFDVELNGGAQYKRLKYECEVYFRFADIGSDITANEVANAAGSESRPRWPDCVSKLVLKRGKPCIEQKVEYVRLRLQHFFTTQKDVLTEFMETLSGSAEERFFSSRFSARYSIIRDNDIARKLIWKKYDDVINQCGDRFRHLFEYSIDAIFLKPWDMIKESSHYLGAQDRSLDEMTLPSTEDTIGRIATEREERRAVKKRVDMLLNQIPRESGEAVESVQAMILLIFQCLRSLHAACFV